MKNTVIATRDFSINGIKFLPGDEVDIIALGQSNVNFRRLVHVRFLAMGKAVRTFEEVLESNKKEEPKAEVVEEPKEEVQEAAQEVAEEINVAQVEENINKSKAKRRN